MKALHQVFVASRGGETRMRIVEAIFMRPRNANALATELKLDYSTVRHSLAILKKHRFVFGGTGYGGTYHITPEFLATLKEYDILIDCYKNLPNCTQRKWERMLEEKT